MFDLISVGDSVIDLFVPLIDAETRSEDGQRKLILRSGDKVPVGPSTSLIGGNAANNAVGSTRLKLNSAIYTNVGDDEDGQRIADNFRSEGVDCRYLVKNKEMLSNHHVVLDFKGERTILVHHQPWKLELPELERTKWVYLTSLSPSFVDTNFIEQLINYLERTRSKLLYNPGTFQIKQGVKKNPRLLSLTEVFIVNKEEAKLVLGFEEGEKKEMKELLTGLHDLGPRQVVVTDGENGSWGFDGENFFELGLFPANLVEMTGAGDAYATGVLAGLLHGKSLDSAMRWGAANAAGVVEQVGPQAGLLTYDQMQERLKANSKIVAKKI